MLSPRTSAPYSSRKGMDAGTNKEAEAVMASEPIEKVTVLLKDLQEETQQIITKLFDDLETKIRRIGELEEALGLTPGQTVSKPTDSTDTTSAITTVIPEAGMPTGPTYAPARALAAPQLSGGRNAYGLPQPNGGRMSTD